MIEPITNIESLCDKASDPKHGCAQITIDFFEKLEEQFSLRKLRVVRLFSERDLKENPIERDEVLAVAYLVGNILEVIDRGRFPKDVMLFQQVYVELHKWGTIIEQRNTILGIPKHKG
jgi:hypothetical protein